MDNNDYLGEYDENAPIDDENDNINEEEEENDRRDVILRELLMNLPRPFRRNMVQFICRQVTKISVILILLYNLIWIIIIKIYSKKEKNELNNFLDGILTSCYYFLFKGLLMLVVPQIIFIIDRRIDDFSFFRVVLQILTSVVLYFVYTRKKIEECSSNKYFQIIDKRFKSLLEYYFKAEIIYIYVITSIFGFLLLIFFFQIVKEIIRANI